MGRLRGSAGPTSGGSSPRWARSAVVDCGRPGPSRAPEAAAPGRQHRTGRSGESASNRAGIGAFRTHTVHKAANAEALGDKRRIDASGRRDDREAPAATTSLADPARVRTTASATNGTPRPTPSQRPLPRQPRHRHPRPRPRRHPHRSPAPTPAARTAAPAELRRAAPPRPSPSTRSSGRAASARRRGPVLGALCAHVPELLGDPDARIPAADDLAKAAGPQRPLLAPTS